MSKYSFNVNFNVYYYNSICNSILFRLIIIKNTRNSFRVISFFSDRITSNSFIFISLIDFLVIHRLYFSVFSFRHVAFFGWRINRSWSTMVQFMRFSQVSSNSTGTYSYQYNKNKQNLHFKII